MAPIKTIIQGLGEYLKPEKWLQLHVHGLLFVQNYLFTENREEEYYIISNKH